VRPVRNSAAYQDFLQLEEQANPDGTIYVITDNLSSHDSKSTRLRDERALLRLLQLDGRQR
jgi:hypothetical protein